MIHEMTILNRIKIDRHRDTKKISISLTVISIIILLLMTSFVGPMSFENAKSDVSQIIIMAESESIKTIYSKKTYGIFVLPEYKTNISRTTVENMNPIHLNGMGWLYARLMQHSFCEYLTWDDIESNTGRVDCTIFIEPKCISNDTLSIIAQYMQSNSCLVIGYDAFRSDLNGWNRSYPHSGAYLTIMNLLAIESQHLRVDNRQANGSADKGMVLRDFGISHHIRELYDYPFTEDQQNAYANLNNSIPGSEAFAMVNYSSSTKIDAKKTIATGRDTGNHRYSSYQCIYLRPNEAELWFDLALWVANDTTQYNLNLWPDGKIFATFQRFDDELTYSQVRMMENLSVPYIVHINNGNIRKNAMEYINQTKPTNFILAQHGANHTFPYPGFNYSYWNCNTISQSSIEANIMSNLNYSMSWASPYVQKWWVSPAGYWQRNISYALENLGFVASDFQSPFRVYRTAFWPAYDAWIMPYQYPFEFKAGKSTLWYFGSQGNPLDPYSIGIRNPGDIGITLKNLYKYADGGIYYSFAHYADYKDYKNKTLYGNYKSYANQDEAFRAEMIYDWSWKKNNSDFWIVRPDVMLSHYINRTHLNFSISSTSAEDIITLTNEGNYAVTRPGFNIATTSNVSNITIGGKQSDSFRYSDGRLFFWSNNLSAGASVVFTIKYGNPSGPYSIFFDERTGEMSPKFSSSTFQIVNDNSSQRSLNLQGVFNCFYGAWVNITPSGISLVIPANTCYHSVDIVVNVAARIQMKVHYWNEENLLCRILVKEGLGNIVIRFENLKPGDSYVVAYDGKMYLNNSMVDASGDFSFSYPGSWDSHIFDVMTPAQWQQYVGIPPPPDNIMEILILIAVGIVVPIIALALTMKILSKRKKSKDTEKQSVSDIEQEK